MSRTGSDTGFGRQRAVGEFLRVSAQEGLAGPPTQTSRQRLAARRVGAGWLRGPAITEIDSRDLPGGDYLIAAVRPPVLHVSFKSPSITANHGNEVGIDVAVQWDHRQHKRPVRGAGRAIWAARQPGILRPPPHPRERPAWRGRRQHGRVFIARWLAAMLRLPGRAAKERLGTPAGPPGRRSEGAIRGRGLLGGGGGGRGRPGRRGGERAGEVGEDGKRLSSATAPRRAGPSGAMKHGVVTSWPLSARLTLATGHAAPSVPG